MVPEVLPKDCRSIKEAEEYLNSYGIYVWHKGDDVNYIKYLLSIGCLVYIATKHNHGKYYFILKKSNDSVYYPNFNIAKRIVSDRPNKLIKFIKNGFKKYVRIINIYEGD